MIGKTVLYYKILERLGEGGMGIVYKAEDTKLKREVAIKFLPRQIAASEEERQRFKIEAQAAAALNHPNIATIHAIEEVDDEMFIVMEYISGKELREIIHEIPLGPPSKKGQEKQSPPFEKGGQGGFLSISDILTYASQIASGLQAAHKNGVVHRDIKSANIMITAEGQVKIMDFGLAKIGGGAQLTKDHSTLGTAAYMSPEQAQGLETDHRTDIWAFGVVLYEMLTGQLPFKGDYEQAVIYAILNEEPEAVSALRPDVPDLLQQVVATALARRPDERYQGMAVVLQNLKVDETAKPGALQAARPGSQKKKRGQKQNRVVLFGILAAILIIAVAVAFWNRDKGKPQSTIKRIAALPLENLGPAEQDYFADGLTGEITSRLSGLSGLSVIARSSAMQYKNTTKSLQQIGEELNVDYVLEGTLQWQENARGGRRIRVNPELIKIADATQIWSQPYEADFSDAFKLQADIAATVAEALNITLVKSEQQALRGKLTDNPEAYDIYLRAVEYSKTFGGEKKYRIAEQLFQKAIALDSNFAAAYASLSTVQSNMHWFYFERSEENLSKSKVNAQRALTLAPNLPEAHVAMGNYHYHGKLDYEPALQEFHEAIRLQPNNTKALLGVGSVLRRQGKMREAVDKFRKTFSLDPRNSDYAKVVGETHLLLGEHDQAEQFFDRAISLAPDAVNAYYYKARVHLLKSSVTKQARTVIEAALERKIGVGDPSFSYTLAICDVLEGNLEEALRNLSGIGKMDDQFMFKPEDLLVARIHRLMKNEPLARMHYESARRMLREQIRLNTEDSRLYGSLGLAYAGFGQKAEAIRAGKRGTELLPISKEAWRGSYRLLDLAQIYTMVNEPDRALDLLDDLLGRPTDAISAALLKIDPTWAPLRQHSRFEKLLEKYSQGEPK
ncbi:MAG: protein kinase [bacterium]